MSKIKSYPAGTVQPDTKILGTSLIGGSNDTQNFTARSIALVNKVSVPATASSTGSLGDYATDTSFVYFCVSTDVWLRASIATW